MHVAAHYLFYVQNNPYVRENKVIQPFNPLTGTYIACNEEACIILGNSLQILWT